jgi:tRNA (adenine57-N1/adenine58-N1)-methyltransferase
MQQLARKNLTRLGLEGRVDFKLGEIADGFDETNADAFFLDVINPYDYMEQVRAALKPGGFFCSLVPTVNQVSQLLYSLRRQRFAFVEVCEIMLRFFKPEPGRLRPVDRMVAHTGYLIFARRIELADDPRAKDLLAEAGVTDEVNIVDKPEEESEDPLDSPLDK